MGDFLNYIVLGLSKLFLRRERFTTDNQLVGLRGRVISGRVTTTFGKARVSTPNGSELTISCRVREGADVPLKGDTVILLDYDLRGEIFDVAKADTWLISL